MPITPNAPDYVGQVRGIIGDLRENYLKKQQLYIQEKDQQERIDLARAQLDMQRQNANVQADIDRSKIALSAQQMAQQAEIEKARYSSAETAAAADAYKDSLKTDLDERKFQSEQQKINRGLEQERKDREAEVASGRLYQEMIFALNSDDPTKLIETTNKLAGSILSQKQKNDVFTNALSLIDAKKRLEQDGINIKTQPAALTLLQDLNTLDVDKYTPDQFAGKLKEYTNQFKGLKNTDPKLNDTFLSLSQDVAKRQNDYMQKEYGNAYSTFLNDAVLGELDPVDQKAWDDLQNQFPTDELKNTGQNYADKTKRLMFQSNKRKSIEELMRMEQSNQARVNNLVAKNSFLAPTDPETGQKSFVVPIPNLTPRVGYDGAIDPNTGRLTKRIVDENIKFVDEITSPSFVYGGTPLQMMLSEMGGQGASPATKTTPQTRPSETAAIPFRVKSNTSFDSVNMPGTTNVAVAPVGKQAPISPETISKIVSTFRQNPDAIIYGRPVKEIIANLKARGYEIADQSTPSESEPAGQTR
jgi:ribosomal protein L9